MKTAGKKTRGFTLVELLITMALLSVIAAAVGAAMVAAAQSYALTARMQEDEHNARLALLAISRDVHRGVEGTVTTGAGELRFESAAGGMVEYTLSGEGVLTRTGNEFNSFVSVELRGFTSQWVDGRIKLTVECTNGMVLETIIAVLRTAV